MIDLELLDAESWSRHADAIMAIERATYEAGRRDSRATFERTVRMERAVCLLARDGERVVGFSFAGPLESFSQVKGVEADPRLGHGDTLYAIDQSVDRDYRGQGLGGRMKRLQVERARELGYRYVAGRNRIGLADPMWRLNQRLGAHEILRVRDAYPDGPPPRDCIYYHIDLASTPEAAGP